MARKPNKNRPLLSKKEQARYAAMDVAGQQAANEASLASAIPADTAVNPPVGTPNKRAIDVANEALRQWGLESLGIDVDALVKEYADNYELYPIGIRNTEGYKKRFAGLESLRKAGNTYGITSEGEYLRVENEYRNVFRQAGLSNKIASSDGTDYQSIADLISKYNQSVDEVQARIADAQRVVNDTSPEVKAALKDFYNIGENDLLAYSLDPANAMADINRKANAATFAGLARQASLNVSQSYAETMTQNLYGAGDIERTRVQQNIQAAAETQRGTERLARLEGGTLSAEETISSQLGTDATAAEKVKGLQSRERARFSGTSAVQRKTLRRGGV